MKHKIDKKIFIKRLYDILDILLLVLGMIFISTGVFFISIAAGLITIGVCLIALAFFIAAKQAKGG